MKRFVLISCGLFAGLVSTGAAALTNALAWERGSEVSQRAAAEIRGGVCWHVSTFPCAGIFDPDCPRTSEFANGKGKYVPSAAHTDMCSTDDLNISSPSAECSSGPKSWPYCTM